MQVTKWECASRVLKQRLAARSQMRMVLSSEQLNKYLYKSKDNHSDKFAKKRKNKRAKEQRRKKKREEGRRRKKEESRKKTKRKRRKNNQWKVFVST
jgi:hypothetical protein